MYKNIIEIKKKLILKNYKISVAESCTGGLLSSKLTSLSGSSNFFHLGLIPYSNLAKKKTIKNAGYNFKKIWSC